MKKTNRKMILAFLFLIILVLSTAYFIFRVPKTPIELLETNPAINSQTVPIKMYIIGEEMEDFPLVLEELNKLLVQKINITLDVTFIHPSNAIREYRTLFKGGNDFDLISMSYHNDYRMLARSRTYMEITDEMLRKTAPKTFEEFSKSVLKETQVDGHTYMLPTAAKLYDQKVIVIRGDLRKKHNILKPKDLKTLESYLYTIRKHEENIMPYSVGESGFRLMEAVFLQPREYALIDNNLMARKISDLTSHIINLSQLKEFKDYLSRIAKWREDGIIPEDTAARKYISAEAFEEGESAIFIGNLYECNNLINKVRKKAPAFQPELIDLSPERKVSYMPASSVGIAVKNGSKYAAKSLMFIELLYTDREVFDLLNLGIEGVHYKKIGNVKYIALDAGKRYPPYNNLYWMMTDKYIREPYHDEEYTAVLENWKKNTQEGYHIYSRSDYEDILPKVSNQEDAYNLLIKYIYPISLGAYKDVEGILELYKTEMKELELKSSP